MSPNNCADKYGEEHFGRALAATANNLDMEILPLVPKGKRSANAKRKPTPEIKE